MGPHMKGIVRIWLNDDIYHFPSVYAFDISGNLSHICDRC